MFFKPKTGVNAGSRNFKDIEKYLKENPATTGTQIAKALGLSRVTVYKHLKKLQNN